MFGRHFAHQWGTFSLVAKRLLSDQSLIGNLLHSTSEEGDMTEVRQDNTEGQTKGHGGGATDGTSALLWGDERRKGIKPGYGDASANQSA